MSGWVDLNDILTEVSDAEVLELDRYRPRPAISTYRLSRAVGPMSERFVEGAGEKLTRAEKRSYANEEWLHEQRSAEQRRGAETRKRNKAGS